jgi:3-deoxy-D-manno-octulosonate 8-phosphate phosphatase (KDO 8-P phosphatase)
VLVRPDSEELMALVRENVGELVRRACRIRVVLSDCDGVLTDASVYVTPSGEELKRFNVRDGLGFARLREAGIRTAFVSGETNACFQKRAEKLGSSTYLGVQDKEALIPVILYDFGLSSLAEVAFIGDDLNDRGLLRAVSEHGLAATPLDGDKSLKSIAHFVAPRRGGHGAFRDFVEWLLELRDPRPGSLRCQEEG